MKKYFYTAKTKDGETKTGVLFAKDESQLSEKLGESGLSLTESVLQEEDKKFGISIPFLNRVSLKEKLIMTRNLQVMVDAGLPLLKSLSILIKQTENKRFKNVLLEIQKKVKKGESFSEALKDHPDIFSDLFQGMIEVGEEGGTLREVLKNLALQMERENSLKSNIKSAMIYPSVIISAMLGIGILMMVMVVPQLESLFKEMEADMPPTTEFLISTGSTMADNWYFLIVFIILILLACFQAVKNPQVRRIINIISLKIPIISTIVKKSNSAIVVRTMASLTSSGVPAVRSLEMISKTLGNFYFRESLIDASKKVKKGTSLSEALSPYKKLYPLGVIEMLKVGEETGKTSVILIKLADFFEEEVERSTQNLTTVIEPVLMIVIGLAVGFFAISVIQPMYSVLSTF